MELVFLQLINGTTLGMVYALTALGFSLVYKALGCLNFSHSNTITMGALIIYSLLNVVDIPYIAAFLIVGVIMLLYGCLIEKIVFKRFQSASPLTFMLVSISLSTVVTNVCQIIFGAKPCALTNVFPNIKLSAFGINLPFNSICIILVAVVFLIALQLYFTKTKFGLALRLAAEDPTTAGLMGINVSITRTATFAISACLGASAGMLFAPLYNVSISLGSSLALKTFIATVVGGLGNLVGAVAGGIIVGLIETFSSFYISSAYKDLIVYCVGIITLVFFPYGLFRRMAKKF